jgi:hypothetical protein
MAVQRIEVLTNLVHGRGGRNLPEIRVSRAVHKVSGLVEIGFRRRSTASGELKIGRCRRSVSTAVTANGVEEFGGRHRSDSTAVRARGVVAKTLRKKKSNFNHVTNLGGAKHSVPLEDRKDMVFGALTIITSRSHAAMPTFTRMAMHSWNSEVTMAMLYILGRVDDDTPIRTMF